MKINYIKHDKIIQDRNIFIPRIEQQQQGRGIVKFT